MVARLEMLLAVFQPTGRGAEVLAALRKMEKAGEFKLQSAAVLNSSSDNNQSSPGSSGETKADTADRPGSLINNIADRLSGPANQTIGKAAGAVTGGAAGNGANLGFDAQTLEGLTTSLPDNSSAVLAVVEEQWVEPLVQLLERSEGKVYRQDMHRSIASQLREGQGEPADDS